MGSGNTKLLTKVATIFRENGKKEEKHGTPDVTIEKRHVEG
jgi:hypothetical protein